MSLNDSSHFTAHTSVNVSQTPRNLAKNGGGNLFRSMTHLGQSMEKTYPRFKFDDIERVDNPSRLQDGSFGGKHEPCTQLRRPPTIVAHNNEMNRTDNYQLTSPLGRSHRISLTQEKRRSGNRESEETLKEDKLRYHHSGKGPQSVSDFGVNMQQPSQPLPREDSDFRIELDSNENSLLDQVHSIDPKRSTENSA